MEIYQLRAFATAARLGNLTRTAEGTYEVTPAKNQSSGLFGPIQKTNCLAVMPEGTEPQPAGSVVDCLLLDIPEEVVL